MRDLAVSLVQCELAWENPEDNRRLIGDIIDGLAQTDLVVLPEMFTTGFSMKALANLEDSGGPTEQWMQAVASQRDCALTGSIATRAGDKAFNRMLFATADSVEHYDKKHLFAYMGEHKRYAAGQDRVIVHYRGWRICLQICYDLRFPVFCRNRDDYDLLIFVANWPSTRAGHWRTLLQARAIENQSYVVGVNRVGADANGLNYSGDSLAIAPDGTLLLDCGQQKNAARVTLDGAFLETYRRDFPFQEDADAFRLE